MGPAAVRMDVWRGEVIGSSVPVKAIPPEFRKGSLRRRNQTREYNNIEKDVHCCCTHRGKDEGDARRDQQGACTAGLYPSDAASVCFTQSKLVVTLTCFHQSCQTYSSTGDLDQEKEQKISVRRITSYMPAISSSDSGPSNSSGANL